MPRLRSWSAAKHTLKTAHSFSLFSEYLLFYLNDLNTSIVYLSVELT